MLILWQDQVAAEAHAEAVALAVVVLAEVHAEVASQVEAASVVALLAQVTAVDLAAAHLEEVLIILPHPHIIAIITDHTSGDPDVAQYFMVAVSVVAVAP